MEGHDTLFVTAALNTVINKAVRYQGANISAFPSTLTIDTHLDGFKVLLTPEQLKNLKPFDPSILAFMMHDHNEETHGYLNELPKAIPLNNGKEN